MPELANFAREFIHLLLLSLVFLDGPLEVEGNRSEEDAARRIASKVREDLVRLLAPNLGASQSNLIVIVATHSRRPFPQGPGDNRRDLRREPIRNHRNLKALTSQAQS